MIEHPASISALPMNVLALSSLIDRWHGIGAFAAAGVSYEWLASPHAIAPQGEAA